MDQELRDALREIRADIKRLLPVAETVNRHDKTLYGNGHEGLVTETEQLKASNRFYNKLFSGIGAILTFFFGNVVWDWYTRK